ncbi:trehalose-phosphatase, partial [candidate division KSB1 bacterium]
DAFKLIKNYGMGVIVSDENKRDTYAEYYLKNPEEVLYFLKFINKL